MGTSCGKVANGFLLVLAVTVFAAGYVRAQESAESALAKGKQYLKENRTAEAIDIFTSIIKENPDSASEAYYNRGVAYRSQGDVDEAIADLTKAIEINPIADDAYYFRGIAYRNKGKFPEAVSDLTHFIELHPQHAEAYCNRANAYAAAGSYPEAISDYTSAIKLDAGYSDAYYNRANAYYLAQQYDKAWEDVHKAEGLGGQINSRFINKLKKASGKDQ